MSAAPRSISRSPLHRKTWFHTTSSSTLTMATRTLPTPPPEGPGATPTEASHAAPPTTGTVEAAPTNPPPAQSQPTPIFTIYREAFPVFASKAIDKDWSGLAALAELHDLRVCPRDLMPPVGDPLTSFHGIYRQSTTVTCRGCCSQLRSYYRT